LTHLNREHLFAMLTKDIQVEIEVLYRQGKGIRAIARDTGIARNTIRTILRGLSDDRYGPRKPRPSKLDRHKPYLSERVKKAGKINLSATVLLREIRAEGYTGGISQLKEYLRSIRASVPIEPVVRFETAPGHQLQIDFVVFRRGPSPLRAFTAELGYSRYSYVEFTDNERSETLAACLERALIYFGGVPKQVLSDNPKTIVIERNAYAKGEHRFNPRLLDLAKHYGFAMKLCAPYRAQTKGKVERFHRYLRESFFAPLQTASDELIDVNIANREVRLWLSEVANCRVHATLKEKPVSRFVVECKALQHLPLPYAGGPVRPRHEMTYLTPVPVESMQHPLAVYDALAREVSA
jgi:transposase